MQGGVRGAQSQGVVANGVFFLSPFLTSGACKTAAGIANEGDGSRLHPFKPKMRLP
jgi:hypothetical protein